VLDPDARDRLGSVNARPEPAEELFIARLDKSPSVAEERGIKSHDTVGRMHVAHILIRGGQCYG
jgi:hypothetical protein